ncbi:aldehyde dehydrogenase [Schizosaccharomyces cryophilus OY26]|uniref:Aldehyde dehydrogenase n=1 Tax=Schizosaccharomyces cryophilus (strain OY26 / ATCC MYA-4695 / CBS 11777 / NBRC 106824 / NRRL Y48691) TaxID=653667 RepID=S9XBB8_SCHCR|nr:aldehyde dehydrogenase [Schizosaccharomyces cryophilus OY26]EPY51051.1 aldehyde dehydrogenase [Schizosaccharomyces cryophilus OY26]
MSEELFQELQLPDGNTVRQPIGLYIDGQWIKSKEVLETVNPATEEIITKVYLAGTEEVDLAVKSARNAFKEWKMVHGSERGSLLMKLADATEKHIDTLSAIEAIDSGKPKDSNARGDVEGTIALLRYCAGWADKIYGSVIPTGPEKLAYAKRVPVGVCGQIVPWNYPLNMAGWKIAPALAAGNCIIIKSAETTPLSLLYFAQLVDEVGFPKGVVNIISGLGTVAGSHIASHSGIDKIAFTGSTKVGSTIQKLASSNLKTITLECGGKSPFIVFEDADIDQAVKWAAVGVMFNSGQICTANSRIYVQEQVYEKFLEKFKEHVLADYKLGSPFEKSTVVGPVVSKAQYNRVLDYIDVGKKEGARMVMGNEQVTSKKGYYIHPTIFADCHQDMTIVKEEIFGPVVAVSKFTTEDEVLEKANDSIYGLAAMCFTKDLERAHHVSEELDTGMVFINSTENSDIQAPFGGVKMSGIGSELGAPGIETYTHLKTVHVNLGNKL